MFQPTTFSTTEELRISKIQELIEKWRVLDNLEGDDSRDKEFDEMHGIEKKAIEASIRVVLNSVSEGERKRMNDMLKMLTFAKVHLNRMAGIIPESSDWDARAQSLDNFRHKLDEVIAELEKTWK